MNGPDYPNRTVAADLVAPSTPGSTHYHLTLPVAYGASEPKRVLVKYCTNPDCGKPREEWPEKRRNNIRSLACSDACRFRKKQLREQKAMRALMAGVRAILIELGDDADALQTLKGMVGMNDPRNYGEEVYDGHSPTK